MRDKRSPTILFRQLLREIALLMGYEITRNLPVTTERDRNPAHADGGAGHRRQEGGDRLHPARRPLGMADGLQDLIPRRAWAISASIAIPRPSVRSNISSSCRSRRGAPSSSATPCWRPAISAVAAADILNRRGVSDADIRFLALVAAPEGMRIFAAAHPTIPVYAAALDDHLNRPRLHRAGIGRRRRPAVRDEVGAAGALMDARPAAAPASIGRVDESDVANPANVTMPQAARRGARAAPGPQAERRGLLDQDERGDGRNPRPGSAMPTANSTPISAQQQPTQ